MANITANDVPAAASGSPNQQASAATPQTEQEIVQELAAMKKRIAQLEAALKQHEAAEQPTTVVHSAKATHRRRLLRAPLRAPRPQAEAALPQTATARETAQGGAICLRRLDLAERQRADQNAGLRFEILYAGNPGRRRLYRRFQPSER